LVLCTVSLLMGTLICKKLVTYSLHQRKVEVMYNLMKQAILFVSSSSLAFNLAFFPSQKGKPMGSLCCVCAYVSLDFNFWTKGLSFKKDGMNIMTMKSTPTPYSLKSFVFSDITLCSQLKFGRRFRGTYRLHLRCRKISQTRNQHEAGSKL
jgi:hypothetical protein